MKNIVVMMSEVFKALGDPKRLRIIRMLASNMENNLCVADIAKKLYITQSAASQHIKVLKNVDILEPNRKGFRVYYNINKKVLNTYKENMDELFKKAFEKCPEYGTCRGHEG
jgi:ArsR family transcriptional regulator